MKPKSKQVKNIAAQAFPEQFKRLRPESGAAGGVKSRSGSDRRRMEIYNGIRAVFLTAHQLCAICGRNEQLEIHHSAGRAGLLLFDVTKWRQLCRSCHRLVHDYPAESKAKGWLK